MKKAVFTILISTILVLTGHTQVMVFKAGNYNIYVTSETNNLWSNYEGTGYADVYRLGVKKGIVNFNFKGLKIARSGAEVFLESGELKGVYSDTFFIKGNYPIYVDSMKYDKSSLKAYYRYYHTDSIAGAKFNCNFKGWDTYFQDGSPAFFPTKDSVYTVNVGNFIYQIKKTALIYSLSYNPPKVYYSGTVAFKYNNDTIKASFTEKTKLAYLDNYSTSSIIHLKPFNILVKGVTFDCSEDTTYSYAKKPKSWKGLYFNSLALSVNSKDSTFIVKPDQTKAFVQTLSYIDTSLNINIADTIPGGEEKYLTINNLQMKIEDLRINYPYQAGSKNYIKVLTPGNLFEKSEDRHWFFNFSEKGFELPTCNSFDTIFKLNPYYQNGKILSFRIKNDNYYTKGIIDNKNKTITLVLPAPLNEQQFQVFADYGGLRNYSGYPDNCQMVFNSTDSYFGFYDFKNNVVKYKIVLANEAGVVGNSLKNSNIEIYPTLVKECITVTNLKINTSVIIEVIDLNGTIQLSTKLTDNKIVVNKLTQGNYFLRIKTNEGLITKRFVKM